MIIKYFVEIWSIKENWIRLIGIILLSYGFLLLCIIGSDSYKTIFLIGLVSSITGGARIFERSKSYLESILKVTYGTVIGIIGGFLVYSLTMVVSVFIVLGFKIPITWDNKEFGIIAYSLGTIGIDIADAMGTPIYASADGVVSEVDYNDISGNYVKIDHGDGYETLW